MNSTVDRIIGVFEGFRMTPLSIDQFESVGKAVLREKISPFVAANKTIKFSIMGFPMKSPNTRDKVLGTLPDLAEEATLENFAIFAQAVKAVYSPGIEIAVVSDGLAFSDVMEVSTNTVDAYQELCEEFAKIKGAPVNWYNLRDFYDKSLSIETVRGKLMSQFGITPEELERRILMDPDVNMLYKGMIRFMNLDLAIKDYVSNTQLQKDAKRVAREMMFRNEAYSKLVQSVFSDHIRLSMHPSINNGVKYSFQLIRSERAHYSAWHSSFFIDKDGILRKEWRGVKAANHVNDIMNYLNEILKI